MIAELRQRKVFRVAAAYGTLAQQLAYEPGAQNPTVTDLKSSNPAWTRQWIELPTGYDGTTFPVDLFLPTNTDYLATRPDVDAGKLGFYGFSMGSSRLSVLLAVEKRIGEQLFNYLRRHSPAPRRSRSNCLNPATAGRTLT